VIRSSRSCLFLDAQCSIWGRQLPGEDVQSERRRWGASSETHRSNSHVFVKEWKSEASFMARALAGASKCRRQVGDPWYRSLFGGQDLRANVRLHTACELQAEEARSLLALYRELGAWCRVVHCWPSLPQV
jgi:hypothetical protein